MNKAAYITLIAGRMVASSIAFLGSIYLANQGKEGWGWLLFAGIVIGGITLTEDKTSTTIKD